jgi:hypothetical protein
LIVGALALGAPVEASARPEWSLRAGYTSLNLGGYKNDRNKTLDSAKSAGYTTTLTEGTNAAYLETDLVFPFASRFHAGLDLQYIFSSSPDAMGYSSPGGATRYSQDVSFGALPIMAVFGFSPQKEKGFNYGARLGIGYAPVWMNAWTHFSSPWGGNDYSYVYTGGDLVAEVGGKAGWEWRRFRLGLDLAYRFLNVKPMTVSYSENPAVVTGKAYENSTKETIPVDFGGVKAGLNFGVKF